MAKFRHSENRTPWFSITARELIEYSGNDYPICDDCMSSLLECGDIVLIPVLNEAFCPKCGQIKLAQLGRYPEDAAVEQRRTEMFLDYFRNAQKGRRT